jgi:hypothetical protein
VQHQLEGPEARGRRRRDVPVAVRERDDLLAGEGVDERAAELAARAGD